MLRVVLAPNPSPMTLQGTQSYIVGRQRCVIIDPGPAIPEHMDAVATAVAGGVVTDILLTHAHPDHAEAGPILAVRLQAELRSGPQGLRDHQSLDTDTGELIALHTPGHSPDHFSFWWPQEQAIFCGDLMMGGLDTTLVAPPDGELGAYLASLERLATLQPRRIYPAHGPAITDPAAAIQRYVQHRLQREEQVLSGLTEQPRSADDLAAYVYGAELEPGLRPYARAAIDAYLEHLKKHGRVRRGHMGWEKLT